MKTLAIELPAHWASWLINRDSSGYTPQEIEEIRAAIHNLAQERGVHPEPLSVGFSFIGRHNGLLTEMAHFVFARS